MPLKQGYRPLLFLTWESNQALHRSSRQWQTFPSWLFFLVKGLISFIIILVLVGFFWSWVNVNSLPLVYDHGDEKRIGAYTGLYYFFSQTAAVLGPTLGGLLVENMNYNYKVLFIFGTVFLFLAFLSMLKVKDRAHEEKLRLDAEAKASS
jgi:MFS family permease